ncbi:hypothetical protein [Kitasatospora sp. Root107]|uniref:hypothetical protein n=1 Tax=Kitasatospora sp. Root107 TaxID=1736424 RepID=UPI0007098BC6|nr:hypothetical protein [Kitasatospora sp. Root107]KQV11887.1 hypothetical protein ASC99_35825 [Kitasatospora sp. Root107]
MSIQPAWHRFGAGAAWRTMAVITALATAAALGTVAPVTAQAVTPAQQGQLYSWIDGWGGGTVTSRPAGIDCHQSAWDPYAPDATYQPPPTGSCAAAFPVGTYVTFTATPDPGSYVNGSPDPGSLTVRSGYNSVWAMFCPEDNLCSSW